MPRVDYDEVSAVYDQRYAAGSPDDMVQSLLGLVQAVAARRVLEVGCGTGHWLTLLDSVVECYGLDFSMGMLEKARQKSASFLLARGTSTHLPYRENGFGLLLCVNALHHFDEPAAFICEAERVLRPGGALAIVGMDPKTESDRWYVYDYFQGAYETDLARYPSGEQLLEWLQEAGFMGCRRLIATRIKRSFRGKEVLADPTLQKHGTSQLALLTDAAYAAGMARINSALRVADEGGEDIVFSVDVALPVVLGFAADAAENTD